MRFRLSLPLLVMSVVTATLLGCGGQNEAAQLTANPWAGQSIISSSGHSAVLPGSTPVIYFKADGTTVGNLTVNTFKGTYTLNNRSIKIGPITSTNWVGSTAEMGQEQVVRDVLVAASRYHITNGILELSDSSGQLLMGLSAAQEPELVGPVWGCTSYASAKGDLVSVVGSSPLSAQFAPDGTLVGSSGVNQFSSTYKVSAGSEMTIGPQIVSTKMAGPDDLMAQEAAYLEAISRTAAFKIADYQMSLLDESGAVIAVYIPLAHKS